MDEQVEKTIQSLVVAIHTFPSQGRETQAFISPPLLCLTCVVDVAALVGEPGRARLHTLRRVGAIDVEGQPGTLRLPGRGGAVPLPLPYEEIVFNDLTPTRPVHHLEAGCIFGRQMAPLEVSEPGRGAAVLLSCLAETLPF